MLSPITFLLGRLFGRSGGGTQDSYTVSPVSLQPQPTRPTRPQIRQQSAPQAFVGPTDLDNYGAETDEMRLAYLKFHRTEPALRAALEGLAASIADSDITVLPEDEDDPTDQRAAKFLEWAVESTPHGWDGLIRGTVLPALLLGYSVGELVLRGVDDHRKWGGLWGVKYVKSQDTHHLRLKVDVYRNVVGVVNTVRGLATYSPDKVILFTHAEMFGNPHGASEARAAYRACQLIDNAYKLWHYALNVYGGPFLKAKTKSKDRRQQLAKALADARQGGFIVIDDQDEVEVLSLASASNFDAFEAKIDKLREEIFLTVRGAYLPFMQSTGGGGETRGSADTAKGSGSDPKERLIAKAVGRALTLQLAAPLTRVNFGPKCGVPRIVLGGVDWQETAAQLDVAKRVKDDFRLPISKKWVYKVAMVPPPQDAEDATEAGPAQPPGGGPSPFGSPFEQPPDQPPDQQPPPDQPPPDGEAFAAESSFPTADDPDGETFAAGQPPFPGAVLREVKPGVHRWVKPASPTAPAAKPGKPAAPAPAKKPPAPKSPPPPPPPPARKPAAPAAKKPVKRAAKRTAEAAPTAKAARAKAAHVMVDRGVQRYAEEYVEPAFAKKVGGLSFPDSEPVDVAIAGPSGAVGHGVELKTMVVGANDKITMNAYAQVRKKLWEQRQGAVFHTVVIDDREARGSNPDGTPAHDEAKRVYYYRRGIAGSARVGTLHRVEGGLAEVRKLIAAPEAKLPDAAKPKEGDWLTAGKWVEMPNGRGYKNTETKQEVYPKK